MALINTVFQDQAEGIIKEGYELAKKHLGIVPKPLEMMSVSPVLFEIMLRRSQYLAGHPSLSFPLLVSIRYLVSRNLGFGFCVDFNRHLLAKQGVEDADFRRMETDPSQAPLEEKESAMLAFVVKAVQDSSSVTKDDINTLRKFGWEDGDMVDALSQGVGMIDYSIMMQVFQIDQHCLQE